MTPEQRRSRAFAAKALLEDETIKAGWQEIEDDLRGEWEATNRVQWRTRDRIWAELRHLKALRHRLATYASHAPRD